MPTNSLKDRLFAIGEEIVACTETCPGFVGSCKKARAQGITPRGLIFDKAIDEEPNGILFIGTNPGKARAAEKKKYLEQGPTYEAILEHCLGDTTGAYFKGVRYFADALDKVLPPDRKFGRNRVWTDLVKCQDDTKHTATELLCAYHNCRTYLDREIALLTREKNYIVVTLGDEARTILALTQDLPFIALPHPSRPHPFYRADLPDRLKERKKEILSFLGKKGRVILELWSGKK